MVFPGRNNPYGFLEPEETLDVYGRPVSPQQFPSPGFQTAQQDSAMMARSGMPDMGAYGRQLGTMGIPGPMDEQILTDKQKRERALEAIAFLAGGGPEMAGMMPGRLGRANPSPFVQRLSRAEGGLGLAGERMALPRARGMLGDLMSNSPAALSAPPIPEVPGLPMPGRPAASQIRGSNLMADPSQDVSLGSMAGPQSQIRAQSLMADPSQEVSLGSFGGAPRQPLHYTPESLESTQIGATSLRQSPLQSPRQVFGQEPLTPTRMGPGPQAGGDSMIGYRPQAPAPSFGTEDTAMAFTPKTQTNYQNYAGPREPGYINHDPSTPGYINHRPAEMSYRKPSYADAFRSMGKEMAAPLAASFGIGMAGGYMSGGGEAENMSTFADSTSSEPMSIAPEAEGAGPQSEGLTYDVQKGNSLSAIAQAMLGGKASQAEMMAMVERMARDNNISDPKRIEPGQRLRVAMPVGQNPNQYLPRRAPAPQQPSFPARSPSFDSFEDDNYRAPMPPGRGMGRGF